MHNKEVLTKLNDGLITIEFLLKNFEYKSSKINTLSCEGEIIKLNGQDFKTFNFVYGIGFKLDMAYKPQNLSPQKEAYIYMSDNGPTNMTYDLYPYFNLDLQFPNDTVENLYNEIKNNFDNKNAKVVLELKFIDPITEVYKVGVLNADDIIIYQGEDYEDDDSNIGYRGDINVMINVLHNKPYTMTDEQKTIYSISY